MPDNAPTVGFDEKTIDAIFAELDQCLLPGVAVGIAVAGVSVYRKGFGLANLELPMVLSPSIRMRIGSTTKHFTALAYMLLCEEGRATPDDLIARHLVELHPVTHKITMRQVMTHVSGLRDAHDISYQFSGTGRPVSSADLLSLYQSLGGVNAPPGTTWSYNNGGYLILGAVIERITGQSLEDVLLERIFRPIGMHDTLLRRWDTDFLPNSATLHMTRPGGGFEKSYLGTALGGEGGMVSTVDDMLRWLAHMDVPVVGSQATWAMMKAPQLLANGTSTGYGLGLMQGVYRGLETLSHAGGVMGGNAQMLKVPAVGLDVVVLSNRHDISAVLLANKIVDSCVLGLDSMAMSTSDKFVTGTFRSSITGRVIQLWAKATQQFASIDGFDLPFEFRDNRVLCPGPAAGYLKWKITLQGDQDKPASVQLTDFGNIDELVAVNETHHAAAVPAIAGRYRSNDTLTEATIWESEDGMGLNSVGRFGRAEYKLECLADHTWRARSTGAMPWGGILNFDADSRIFRFTSLRNKSLSFRRDP